PALRQKRPGVVRPACMSAARFAAFAPMRSGSATAASVSGMMNSVIRRCPALASPAEFVVAGVFRPSTSFILEEAKAWIPGSVAWRRPGDDVDLRSTSFHVIDVTGNRIHHGDLLDREVGDDLDL